MLLNLFIQLLSTVLQTFFQKWFSFTYKYHASKSSAEIKEFSVKDIFSSSFWIWGFKVQVDASISYNKTSKTNSENQSSFLAHLEHGNLNLEPPTGKQQQQIYFQVIPQALPLRGIKYLKSKQVYSFLCRKVKYYIDMSHLAIRTA